MTKATVLIHGDEWEIAHIREEVEYAKTMSWHKADWKARPAIVDKYHSSPYVGQKYDPSKVKLVKGGWTHDHCAICFWSLFESDDPATNCGYTTDGNNWLCTECYERFVIGGEIGS